MNSTSPIFKNYFVFLFIILVVQNIRSAYIKAECSKWASNQSTCKFVVGDQNAFSVPIQKGKMNYMVVMDYFVLPTQSQQHTQPAPTLSLINLSEIAAAGGKKTYGNCKFCDTAKCLFSKEEFNAAHSIITDELYNQENQMIFAVCNAKIIEPQQGSGSFGPYAGLEVHVESMPIASYGVISIPFIVIPENAPNVQAQYRRLYYGLLGDYSLHGKFPIQAMICRNQGVLAVDRFTQVAQGSKIMSLEDPTNIPPIQPNILSRFSGMQCDDDYAKFYFPYNPYKERYSYDGTRRII